MVLGSHVEVGEVYDLARRSARRLPALFAEAKLSAADGADWRPQETLPEDFYTA